MAERSHAVVHTPVGSLWIAAHATAITGLYMEEQSHPPSVEDLGTGLADPAEHPVIAQAVSELGEYFAGERTVFEVPTDARGTEFQKRVWAELARIPFGESRTYGQLALALGDVKLTRAVGAANGCNPVSIMVPCHRVIGADGSLTGYAGGLERKLFLLRLEGIVPEPEDTLF